MKDINGTNLTPSILVTETEIETCKEYLNPCLCAIGMVCLTEAFLWLRKSKNFESEANGQIVGGKKQKRNHK